MLTKRHFRVWGIAFALLVVGLLAALPVLADPGIRLGSPDALATGYARVSAPSALPVTGAQPTVRSGHTVGEIPRVQSRPWHTVGELARFQPRAWHTVAELIQAEAGLAARTEQESLRSMIERGWRPR